MLAIQGLVLINQVLGDNLPALVNKVKPAIVTIIVYDQQKRVIGSGSGFFINKEGHLITNHHVLFNSYTSAIVTYEGKNYPITRVIAANENSDLIKVAVDIPLKEYRWIEVAHDLLAPAEHVMVIGSPMGLDQTISDGIVSFVPKQIDCGTRLTVGNSIQITAPISSGSSGSPVIDMKGKVVGVATFMFVKGQNLNFAAPGKCILNLSEEKIDKPLSEWSYEAKKKILSRAEQLYKNKNYEMAIVAYEEIIKSNPNLSEAYYGLGKVYTSFMIVNSAVNSLDIEKNPLGYRAIGAFKEAIRINPDFAEAHCELGSTYDLLLRLPEAVNHLKIAIALKPNYVDAHYNLGVVFIHLGNKSDALNELRIVKELDSEQAQWLEFLFDWFEGRRAERRKEEHEIFENNKQKTDDGVRIYKDKKGTIVITDQ